MPFTRNFMTPPVLAVLSATVVGLVPPVKNLLFSHALKFLMMGMNTVGGVAVPGLLIPMGAILAAGPGSTKLPARVVVGLVVLKLLLLPLLGAGTVLAAWSAGLVKVPDNLFLAVILSAHGL